MKEGDIIQGQRIVSVSIPGSMYGTGYLDIKLDDGTTIRMDIGVVLQMVGDFDFKVTGRRKYNYISGIKGCPICGKSRKSCAWYREVMPEKGGEQNERI